MDLRGDEFMEYKSSLFVVIKNVVYGIGAAFVAALVLSWFINGYLALLLGMAAGAAIIYFAVHGDNIRVLLDDDTVSFYRGKKLLHAFNRVDHSFRAHVVTTIDSTGSDSDCDLTVIAPDGSETRIDCSMLGYRRFMGLLDGLGFNDQSPEQVETVKKTE